MAETPRGVYGIVTGTNHKGRATAPQKGHNAMNEPIAPRLVACVHCNHIWPTKGEPAKCPKCRRRDWDNTYGVKRPQGRPRRTPKTREETREYMRDRMRIYMREYRARLKAGKP